MVEKMITMHIIAYNLIRSLIQKTARKHNINSDRISFKGSLDAIMRFASKLCVAKGKKFAKLLETLDEIIASDLLPYRPNRIEPRVKKRRPKPFSLMTQSRVILRLDLDS
jgi:hypothetical protein